MVRTCLKYFFGGLLFGPLIIWAALALWIDGPVIRPLAGGLALAFIIASLLILARYRPFYRAAILFAFLFSVVVVWWKLIPPSNDRDWRPEVARLPTSELNGEILTVHNVRNFNYRAETDFDEHWEERNYDLSKLRGVDLFLVYWGSPYMAHTIVSWEFADGPPLAISIETRKKKGQEYSAVLGFFRQYELYYVVADERDVVRLRSNYRGEQVYLYRFKASSEEARKLLLAYFHEINAIATHPKWYNAFADNCTTGIRNIRKTASQAKPWDWRILVNGYLDELSYVRGSIDTSLPFAELKKRSFINDRAVASPNDEQFSTRIREGLPGVRN